MNMLLMDIHAAFSTNLSGSEDSIETFMEAGKVFSPGIFSLIISFSLCHLYLELLVIFMLKISFSTFFHYTNSSRLLKMP